MSVRGESAPLLLVGAAAGLTAGPVESAAADGTLLLPGQEQEVELAGVSTRVLASGAVERGARPEPIVTDYRLSLERGGTTQLLAELPELDGAAPGLVWAGDLDRDGELDFLFDMSGSYNSSRLVLFLSGAAAAGELVAPVAERITSGC